MHTDIHTYIQHAHRYVYTHTDTLYFSISILTASYNVDNLQLPATKSKAIQSKSRKRRPFLIRKFEGTTPCMAYGLQPITFIL